MPILGITMPKMGIQDRVADAERNGGERGPVPHARGKRHERASVIDALFSRTRQRVLGLLFGQPNRRFFANELIALTGSGSGAVQRELGRLTDSGLVTLTRSAGRAYFQANPQAPLFEELRSMMLKTVGFAEPIRAALARIAPRIRCAVVYGSLAKGTDTAGSDIDLLIVSNDLTLEAAYAASAPAERKLSRKVSVNLYTEEEFHSRLRDPTSFLARVLAGEHIVLMGSDNGSVSP